MGLKPLGYRSWKGKRLGALLRFWPIARGGIALILRRKIFWIFLFLSLMSFLFHSGVIYLVAQVEGQMGQRIAPGLSRDFLFTGTGTAYRNFILSQGPVVMMLLALGGGLLVGNDFRTNALSFYLSKPIGKADYFLGKFAAAFALTAMITLLPAAVLFLEYGAFSETFSYYWDNLHLLGKILAYGALASAFISVLLLGVASLLKRMIPILLAWGGIFVFLPAAVQVVRHAYEEKHLPIPWGFGLLDLWWGDLGRVSNVLFGIEGEAGRGLWPWSVAVLAGVSLLSLLAFWRKISAVEVVR